MTGKGRAKAVGPSSWNRLLIIAGCALLLPVILVLALLMRDQFQQREADAAESALGVARELIVLVDARLAGDLQVMRILGTSTALAARKFDDLRVRAEGVLGLNPGWTSVTLTDRRDGRVVFSTEAGPDGPPDWPIAADLSVRGRVGGVERDGAGCPCVILQLPALLEPDYLLTVTLDPSAFQALMLDRLPAGVVAAIVDRDGDFVARSLDFAERVGTPATRFVREAAAKGGDGLYEGETYEGFVNVTAYASSPVSGWSAHVAIDRGLVTGPRARSAVALLGGSILALALAGIMISYAFKDLADRRRAEARLVEMQKAEAVGRFTGTVVHDFNNLLAVMQASLNLIARTTAEPGTREKVEMAKGAIQRGARLTNQLLSFARAGDAGGAVEVVDLGGLVASVEDMLRKLLGGRVALEVRIAPDAREVLANADQMELALVNLAANARDAIDGAGRVTIATERLGDMVALRFRDTGEGFAPEIVDEIFRPFFTTKPPGKGTGLGLAQVAGAVRQAGGEIAARNTPSGGAEFVLTLPAAGAGEDAEPSAA